MKLKSKYTISEDLYRVLKTNYKLRTRGKYCGLAVQSNIYKIPIHLTLRDSVDTTQALTNSASTFFGIIWLCEHFFFTFYPKKHC